MSNTSGIDSSVDGRGGTGPGGDGDAGEDDVDTRFASLSLDSDVYRYKMDYKKRGSFIIINNKNFDPKTQMNARTGTDADAANLYAIFKSLGFDVTLHHDQTKRQMFDIMIRAGDTNHADCDTFGVAVLTHGDDDVLYGTDEIIAIDKFVAPIKGCKTLVGKPKLFFFQACRGNELDHGVESSDAVASDGSDTYKGRIPVEADCLYAYSTVPGYFSWRNSSKGSWFVQAFNLIMKNPTCHDLEFVRLLTRVSHAVANQFESNASQAHMNRKKQVPSIVSMLTKDLYLKPKN